MPVKKKTMADGSARYYVETRSNGRKVYHRGAYATRREAEVALSRLKVSKASGTYRAPESETVSSYLDAWLTRKAKAGDHRPRTSEYYRGTVALYVAPTIGDVRLSDVRPRHIQTVVDAMSEGKRGPTKPATVHRRYRMLAAALADAVRSDRLTMSPCRGLDLPKLTGERVKPPTPDQVGRIVDAAPQQYRVPLALCAFGGLRRGEALGLRWSDVDLEGRVLYVRQAATFVGREVTFDRPKSRDSERAVPMAPQLVEVLRSAKGEQAARRLRIGEGWRDLDLVADGGDGSPMHPERLSQGFRKLARRLGVGVRLHDLRHAAVTVQLAAGVPLAIVSAVAGHSSTAFTARQYGHLQPDHLRSAADAMERAYAGGEG